MIEGDWRREEARTRREGETGLWGGGGKRTLERGTREAASLSESEHATVSVPVSEKLHYSLMGGFTAERERNQEGVERGNRDLETFSVLSVQS